MKKINHLTEGSILKSLLKLSGPIIFANILQTAYQLTDTFWVGRLGSVAVAAVSVSFPIIFLIVSLGGGLAMAGSILVSQYKGKEDNKAVNYIALQTLSAVFFVSVILAFLGFELSSLFVSLMNVKENVFRDAVLYLKFSFIGMIFTFIYMTFQALMRGVGDVKTPMFIVLGTVLLNFILDPLFIFGYKFIPSFGVVGAALSTIGTQMLATIIALFILIKGKHQISLSFQHLKFDWGLIKKMFKLGFPTSIEQSTRALSMTVMIFLVSAFGTIALASYGIGSRILMFVIIPAMGLSMATSTLVGQNIGANKIKRAEKITHLSAFISFFLLSTIGFFLFVFAKELSEIFIPNDREAILSSAQFVRIMAVSFGFIGIQMSLNGLFRGSGNTKIPMILSIISLWFLRIPLAYFLSKYTSLKEIGIWLSFPISNVLSAILIFFWFMNGTWKNKKLIKEIKIVRKEKTML